MHTRRVYRRKRPVSFRRFVGYFRTFSLADEVGRFRRRPSVFLSLIAPPETPGVRFMVVAGRRRRYVHVR